MNILMRTITTGFPNPVAWQLRLATDFQTSLVKLDDGRSHVREVQCWSDISDVEAALSMIFPVQKGCFQVMRTLRHVCRIAEADVHSALVKPVLSFSATWVGQEKEKRSVRFSFCHLCLESQHRSGGSVRSF